MSDFKVGDKVRLVRHDSDTIGVLVVGDTGVVRTSHNHDKDAGVEWEIYHPDLHDLGGNCKKGHGWYVDSNCLELVSEGEEEKEESPVAPTPAAFPKRLKRTTTTIYTCADGTGFEDEEKALKYEANLIIKEVPLANRCTEKHLNS